MGHRKMYDLHVARLTPRDLDLTLLRKQQGRHNIRTNG